MNLTQLQRKLGRERQRLARLEAQVVAKAKNQFAGLPRKYGFKSMDHFIVALAALASTRLKGRLGAGKPKTKAQAAGKSKAGARAGTGRRRRARITDKVRAKVIADLRGGKLTGAEVAAKYGISVPSVNLIKKAAGLTKSRK